MLVLHTEGLSEHPILWIVPLERGVSILALVLRLLLFVDELLDNLKLEGVFEFLHLFRLGAGVGGVGGRQAGRVVYHGVVMRLNGLLHNA